MIDWGRRNGGFLDDFNVYGYQISNLSMQINEKGKEIERLNKELDIED